MVKIVKDLDADIDTLMKRRNRDKLLGLIMLSLPLILIVYVLLYPTIVSLIGAILLLFLFDMYGLYFILDMNYYTTLIMIKKVWRN